MFGFFKKKEETYYVDPLKFDASGETTQQYIDRLQKENKEPNFNRDEQLLLQLMEDTNNGIILWQNNPAYPDSTYWKTLYKGYNVIIYIVEDEDCIKYSDSCWIFNTHNFIAEFTSISDPDNKKIEINKYCVSGCIIDDLINLLAKVCPPKAKETKKAPREAALDELLR